jgi:hypothetical protein
MPWSWALFENLQSTKLLKNFPLLYGADGSLPCSQEPSTGPYPEPDEFSLQNSFYLSKIHFNITLSSTMYV